NEVARRYDEALAGSGLVLPRVPEDYTSSWAQYTAQLPKGVDRTALQDALKERGVPTMVYYPKPMHEQGAFEGTCVVAPGGCSVTERLCATVLSLPMGPYVGAEGVGFACSALLAYDSLGFDV
ncbi:DegT/DnrJ/EryC1/StrS family aminotransferase, partial [Adlercreutzia sp.]